MDKYYEGNLTVFDNEDKKADSSEDYKKYMNRFLKESSEVVVYNNDQSLLNNYPII